MTMTRYPMLGIIAITTALSTMGAGAQTYPTKPIRLISAYPPGGPNDLSARTVGQGLSELLGQPVLVENRPGAAGNIGSQSVAVAAPDGYTLLNGASALTIAPALKKNLGYDVVRDFAPISLTAASSFVLAVHPSVPVNSVKELIALARARPGDLSYASSGVGAPPHLAGELLKSMAKINIVHVPYKGVGQSISDLVAGHIEMMFTSPPNAIPQVKAKHLKALAVSTPQRSPLLPNVPTVAESGLPGFQMGTWFGILAPAGTPKEIVERLNAATRKVVGDPRLREKFASRGLEARSSTPGEFSAYIRSELAKFQRIVREAGIKPE